MVWFSMVTMSRSVSAARRMVWCVEGLDGGYVQHRHVDVVGLEPLGDGQRTHGHQSGGDEHHVATGAQLGSLAQFEVVVVLVEHGGYLAAQQPHVGGSGMRGQRWHGLFDVHRVTRVHDGQVRHAAQNGQVLGGLVAGADPVVSPGSPPTTLTLSAGSAMSRHKKLGRRSAGEHRVGGRERHQAHFGHAGGGAD